jgi:hypothetical protein
MGPKFFSTNHNNESNHQNQSKFTSLSNEDKKENKGVVAKSPQTMGLFQKLPTVLYQNLSQFLTNKDVANLNNSNSLLSFSVKSDRQT